MNSKAETYLGFAIRKGAVVFGTDNITTYKKKMYLIAYTKDISDNSLSRLVKTAKERNLSTCILPEMNVLKMRNCKAVAVCDKSLADAILLNV